MPEIPTYTASGRIETPRYDGESIDAATRPWEAAARAGGSLVNLGGTLASLAGEQRVVAEQKKKESELSWLNEAVSQYGRTLFSRQVEDSKNPRETEGSEFSIFANEQLQEFSKAAPSERARDLFRQHATRLSDHGWRTAMGNGEHARLQNLTLANTKTTANNVAAYKDLVSVVGPDAAAATISPLIQLQLASIEQQFGKTAPNTATKMRIDAVEEIAIAAASTNPRFARQIVKSAPITEESKLLIGNRIDSINSTAVALERERFERRMSDVLSTAINAKEPVPEIPDGEFEARYGERWQLAKERFDAARTDTNTAIQELHKLGAGVNPYQQAKEVEKAATSDNLSLRKAAPEMAQMARASAQLANRDPVAWQDQNDPDIQDAITTLATLPDDAQAQFRRGLVDMRLARQGHAPAGAEHPERYLGRDRAFTISSAEADRRKTAILSASPDSKLQILSQLEAEFGDSEMANRVYSDMLELGSVKIPVTYRFAGIINNEQTKKEFVDAQTNAKALADLDDTKRSAYTDELDKAGGVWEQFKMGWYGQSGEGVEDIRDAKAALVSYAQHLQQGQGLSPKDAIKTAVQKVIGDNYGFANINGRVIPVQRKRASGQPDRTDAEISDIGRRLSVALKDIPVRELATKNPTTGAPYYPNLPPSADMTKPEDAQILRDYITTKAFWEMDASGEMVTLKIADDKNFGFSVLDKDNRPLTVKLDDLPSYMQEFETGGTDATQVLREPTKASKTYPIKSESWWNKIGVGSATTNWPTRPAWLGKDPRNFRVQ